MKVDFGFGSGIQKVDIPDANLLGVLRSNDIEITVSGGEAVEQALAEPIGSLPLHKLVAKGEKIAIITSDITRPMPTAKVMPYILKELSKASVDPKDVTLVFALGSHRKHTEEEKLKLAGEEAYNTINIADSDVNDCIRMGVTDAGTPVDITRVVAEADKKICLGNIEFHYFAGYSGGYKAIMPGVSTREAIQQNHRLMTDENACAGNLEGNPLRMDIEQAGKICGVDFILNVVLDEHKNIIKAVAGDPVKAHRAGAEFLDRLYSKRISQKADIVLVSQGGSPKDLNLYQTQKALDNAKHAVKDGGTIILIGSCKEGLGEKKFEEWMTTSPSAHYMVERIGREFVLGGHKAAAIGMVLDKADIILVSELEPEFVSGIFLKPYDSAQRALDDMLIKYGSDAKIWAIPYGGSILPKLEK